MDIYLTFYDEPIPLERQRVSVTKSGKLISYLPKKSSDYRRLICAAAQVMWQDQPLTGKLKIDATFYRDFEIDSKRFGDLDNHLKAILDSLSGIVYTDDSQIVKIAAQKARSDKPRTELIISQL